MKKINLALVGASGIVGQSFIKILDKSKLKSHINNLYLFASEKSAGQKVIFDNKEYVLEKLTENNIKNKKLDYAFFSAGEEISKTFAPIFNRYGIVVIDNSSAFRMENNVPLVVPEINFEQTSSLIISNPNCSTIECVLPLFVLQKNFGLKSVNFSTYQAVSGSGVYGVEDLISTQKGEKPKFYPYSIAENCLPHIGTFVENGYSTEELKMIYETQKILKDKKLKITATCVRVPVKNCHSVVVSAKLKLKADIEKIKELFTQTLGIKLVDNLSINEYPVCELANNKNDILVGRIRQDLFDKSTVHFFCVADNIRKGAALNGVQILEKLLQN